MVETSHDARSGKIFTVDRRALSAVIIKYSNNKGLVHSAFLGTVAWRCVTLHLKHSVLSAFL